MSRMKLGVPSFIAAAMLATAALAAQVPYVSGPVDPSNPAAIVIPSTGGTTDVINIPVITPVLTGLAVYGANGAGPGSAGSTTASKTAGQGCTLVGAGGGASLLVGADF